MLEIRLLGQFDVRLDGKTVGVPTRPAQSLLAYLFLNSEVSHRREKLAGLLWPDASEGNARSNLRHELWRLRKAIETGLPPGREFILADEIGIVVNPRADYWLDVAELEKGSAEADADLMSNRLALYRGELLPGFYDDWVMLERERAQALFEQQIQRLLDRLAQEYRWQETLDWGERWIALGQCPEPAYRALMVAHGALGDRSKVAATYRRCAESLRAELGVEPSEQTRMIFERLTRGESLTPISPVPSLGAPPHPAVVAWEEPPAPGEPPFKGLEYFDEADANWFFGREFVIARMVERLRASRSPIVLVGASGSGKSSVLRAGVLPALKRGQTLADGTRPPEGSSRWQFHLITPTAHPLEAVAASLTRDSNSVAATAALMDDLARDPRSLHLAIARLLRECREEHVFVAVDQFEELFTLCRDPFEREAFVDNLLTAVSPETAGPTTLMIALRADFYPHLAQYPDLRDAVARNQEYIGPMSMQELRRAIEEPARRGGWKFEPALVDLFLREVADEPGALPLLSHALLETWKHRRGRTLTLKGYAEAGGVRGAIAQTAQSVYENLPTELKEIARNIFLRLTELGEGTLDTRRRATIRELIPSPEEAPAVEQVLTLLADARLITTGEGSVEIAHEALIREWPTLREWLNQDREGLRVSRHLADAAREWERLERDPGALYRGARLAQASDWAQSNASALNPLERDFIAASIEAASSEAAEREVQRQRELESAQKLAQVEKRRAEEEHRAAVSLRRRALYFAGALVVALMMAGAALFFGEQARSGAQRAQAQAQVASSRELAAAAINAIETDPERSILLGVEAVRMADTHEAEDALHRALLASRVQLTLRGHAGEVWSVAFSPDGTRLATASQDKTAKVWDAVTGKLLLTLAGHGESVSSIAFSPDGTRIATGSQDDTAKVWEAATGKEMVTLTGHTSGIYRVVFSPDGTRLATASRDRTAKIWDALTGKELLTLRSHLDQVLGVAFSPDGKLIATGSNDGSAIIWDASTGAKLLTARGGLGVVAFTPDGMRLVAAGGQSTTTATVLDVLTGATLLSLSGHTNLIYSLAVSVDGTRVATGSLDKTAKVWDAATGQVLLTLTGHTGAVFGVAFSPDGTRLATGSTDGTVRVWNIGPSRELLTLTMPPGSGQLGLSPDWKLLAAGLSDGTAEVSEVATGKKLLTLAGHSKAITTLAFSRDGQHLATGSGDATAKVWDVKTGRELVTLLGHRKAVTKVAFSPDGKRLITVGDDLTAKVWDANSGQELFSRSFPYQVHSAAFSPDGMRLATADDGAKVLVWDLASGKDLLTLLGHSEAVLDVAFSEDGKRLATTSQDGTAKLWDAATGRELFTLSGHTAGVVAAAFSPDSLRLATAGSDRAVKVWDVASGHLLLTLAPGDAKGLGEVTFSPDGTQLAAIGKEELRIYALPIQDLVALAHARVTRSLTTDECVTYLHLAGAACARTGETPIVRRIPTQLPSAKGRICQVATAGTGGLGDKSINQMVHAGIEASVKRFDWSGAARESMQYVDYARLIAESMDSRCDLIVMAFSDFADVTKAAAQANPKQKFLILDVAYDQPLDNVWGQVYAADQGAFLAGYVAASTTKTGKVGTFGGIPMPPVNDFMDGFALGAAYYNAKHGTNVQVLGWDVNKREGLFAGDFCCAELGARTAEQLIGQGADIIMPVAGPLIGLGAIDAAQKHQVYFIGVDTDWVVTAPEYAPIVLTSVEKRMDVSVVAAVKAIVDGKFAGGTHVGTLATGEVGLSPFHDLDVQVSPQVKSELEEIKAEIIAGKIKTKP